MVNLVAMVGQYVMVSGCEINEYIGTERERGSNNV